MKKNMPKHISETKRPTATPTRFIRKESLEKRMERLNEYMWYDRADLIEKYNANRPKSKLKVARLDNGMAWCQDERGKGLTYGKAAEQGGEYREKEVVIRFDYLGRELVVWRARKARCSWTSCFRVCRLLVHTTNWHAILIRLMIVHGVCHAFVAVGSETHTMQFAPVESIKWGSNMLMWALARVLQRLAPRSQRYATRLIDLVFCSEYLLTWLNGLMATSSDMVGKRASSLIGFGS